MARSCCEVACCPALCDVSKRQGGPACAAEVVKADGAARQTGQRRRPTLVIGRPRPQAPLIRSFPASIHDTPMLPKTWEHLDDQDSAYTPRRPKALQVQQPDTLQEAGALRDEEVEPEDEEPVSSSGAVQLPGRAIGSRGDQEVCSTFDLLLDEWAGSEAGMLQDGKGADCEFCAKLERRPLLSGQMAMSVARCGPLLRVQQLRGNGAVEMWNQEHPDRRIMVSDDIVEVNGVSGDTKAMMQALSTDVVLHVRIRRGLIAPL